MACSARRVPFFGPRTKFVTRSSRLRRVTNIVRFRRARMSGEAIGQVVQALQTLYTSQDASDREKANTWLGVFQKSASRRPVAAVQRMLRRQGS